MNKKQFKQIPVVLSTFGLLFGLFLVLVSLISVSQAYSVGNKAFYSNRQVYLDGNILPDHLFYPLLMVKDRLVLESLSLNDQLYLQIKYADQRVNAAERLLEKNSYDLALTTLTKGQKYLIMASHSALSNDVDLEIKQDLAGAIKVQCDKLSSLKPRFSAEDQVIIDNLLTESKALRAQLLADSN